VCAAERKGGGARFLDDDARGASSTGSERKPIYEGRFSGLVSSSAFSITLGGDEGVNDIQGFAMLPSRKKKELKSKGRKTAGRGGSGRYRGKVFFGGGLEPRTYAREIADWRKRDGKKKKSRACKERSRHV